MEQRTRSRRVDPDAVTEEETPPWNEEAPRRRRRAQSETVDEDIADEDADGEDSVLPPIFKGRAAIKANRPSSDASYFKWADNGEVQVVKFLDVDPWSYNQHWVTRAGKQSFPCIGKNCPLCEIGSKVTAKVVYSLLNFSVGEEPVVQTLEVTQSIDDLLSAFDLDKKTGPLSKMWYALSRTKKQRSSGFGSYNYHILPIKDRDLEEDHNIILDDAEDAVEKAEAPEPAKVLGKVGRRTLQEIADEASDH